MAKKLCILFISLVAILLAQSHAEIETETEIETPTPAPAPAPSPTPAPAPEPLVPNDNNSPAPPGPRDNNSPPAPRAPSDNSNVPTDGTTEGSLKPEECDPRCEYRCSSTHHKKPCLFFCKKCCATCLCVPPGTYGNKEVCPCYNNWKTKRGGPKCP